MSNFHRNEFANNKKVKQCPSRLLSQTSKTRTNKILFLFTAFKYRKDSQSPCYKEMYTQYDLYVCNKQIFSQRKREDDNIAPKIQNLYKDLKLKQTKAEKKTNILEKAKHILIVKIQAQTKTNPIV